LVRAVRGFRPHSAGVARDSRGFAILSGVGVCVC
jgi:hypothetical protein